MAAQEQPSRPSFAGRPDRRSPRIVAVLCCWFVAFVWIGAMKSLAVLMPTLRDQMETYTWVVGWMIVIMEVAIDVVGEHGRSPWQSCNESPFFDLSRIILAQ